MLSERKMSLILFCAMRKSRCDYLIFWECVYCFFFAFSNFIVMRFIAWFDVLWLLSNANNWICASTNCVLTGNFYVSKKDCKDDQGKWEHECEARSANTRATYNTSSTISFVRFTLSLSLYVDLFTMYTYIDMAYRWILQCF